MFSFRPDARMASLAIFLVTVSTLLCTRVQVHASSPVLFTGEVVKASNRARDCRFACIVINDQSFFLNERNNPTGDILRRLSNGDRIRGTGVADDKVLDVQTVYNVGLKNLIGPTWRSHTEYFMRFENFEKISWGNSNTVYNYTITPGPQAGSTSWMITFAAGAVRQAILSLYATNKIGLQFLPPEGSFTEPTPELIFVARDR